MSTPREDHCDDGRQPPPTQLDPIQREHSDDVHKTIPHVDKAGDFDASQWRQSQACRTRRTLRYVVVTIILILSFGTVIPLWRVYSQWRLGSVVLSQHEAPILLLEIYDTSGDELIRVVPLEARRLTEISLPAGDYRVRASAPGVLETSYRMFVTRGVKKHYTVRSQGHDECALPAISLAVGQNEALLSVPGNDRDSLVLCSENSLRLLDSKTAPHLDGSEARLFPEPSAYRPLRAGKDVVLWRTPLAFSLRSSSDTSRASAARCDGSTGKPLWHLTEESGIVNGPPAVTDTGSLIFSRAKLTAQENGRGIHVASRWIECRDTVGTQLWTYELDPTWFPLKTARNEHTDALWYEMYEWLPTISEEWDFQRAYVPLYGPGAANELFSGSELRAAYPPAVVRLDGQSVAMVSAGSRLLGLQTDTGRVVWDPLALGFIPIRPPQWADFDDDGQTDVLFVKWAAGLPDDSEPASLQTLSLKQRSIIWQSTLRDERLSDAGKHEEETSAAQPTHPLRYGRTDWNCRHFYDRQRPSTEDFQWPLVRRLEPNGSLVVVVPVADNTRNSGDGAVQCLDGLSGRTIWSSSEMNVQQILAANDVNSDGLRDLAIITTRLSELGRPSGSGRLPVDAFQLEVISGRDGSTLSRAPITGLISDDRGEDTVFQAYASCTALDSEEGTSPSSFLVVPRNTSLPVVVLAVDGRVLTRFRNLQDVIAADVTGSGRKAVCGITQDGFGRDRLWRFTVRHEELWRRLGSWYPVGDLNGDGVHDLVPVEDAPMAAVSGSDGSVLWSTSVSGHVHHDLRSTTLVPGPSEDLNGDDTPDVIIFRKEERREEPEEESETRFTSKSVVVVQALNGKSGRVLWSTPCVPSDPRTDLSSGGSLYAHLWHIPQPTNLGPNVCLVFKRWGGEGVDNLFVLSGRTGRVSWRMSTPYISRVAAGDLNGDGSGDLVIETPIFKSDSKKPGCRLQAVRGSDGAAMWNKDLSVIASSKGKVDDDRWRVDDPRMSYDPGGELGQPTNWVIHCMDGQSQSGAVIALEDNRLFLLEGQNGSERWTQSLGQMDGIFDQYLIVCPLKHQLSAAWVVRRGGRDWPRNRSTQLYVFGPDGLITDQDLPSGLRGRRVIQVLPADLNGNGQDELLIVAADDRDSIDLRLYDPELTEIWHSDRTIPKYYELRVFAGQQQNLVVVRGGAAHGSGLLRGFVLDGATGQLLSSLDRSDNTTAYANTRIVPLGRCHETGEGLLFEEIPLAGADSSDGNTIGCRSVNWKVD